MKSAVSDQADAGILQHRVPSLKSFQNKNLRSK